MRRLCFAVVLVLAVSSCTSGADVAGTRLPATVPQVVVDAYVEAFNAGDMSTLFSVFGDDVSYSLRPLTWSPAEGPTEAVAATMQAIANGWVLEITDRVVGDGVLSGAFVLETHGPTLTGTVEVRTDVGTITAVTYDLDEQSQVALDSPYLYLRTVQSFAPMDGARGFWGELEGALYQIEVPDDWNGSLFIWGNGFKAYALGLSVSPPPMSEYLIRNGYAWAATSFSTNGFDPMRFAEDAANLHDFFIEEFGEPEFTYIAGSSMGGGVTLLSQQLFPARFDGALAVCSVVGQEDGDFFGHYLALAAYGAGVSQIEFDAAPSLEVLTRNRIIPTLRMNPAAWWRFEELMTAITGGPRPFRHEGFSEFFDSNFDAASWTVASGEFTNIGFSYPWVPALEMTADELNARVVRIDREPRESDPSRLTGEVSVPLIMLHTTGDGLIPITAMQSFRRLAEAAGDGSHLVQRAIRAPGHCEVSPAEIETAMADLTRWVEQGIEPEGEYLFGPLENVGLRFTNPRRDGDPGGL
ncbi:MAG: DUF6351 family protein [Acidimicrobiia bacterium]